MFWMQEIMWTIGGCHLLCRVEISIIPGSEGQPSWIGRPYCERVGLRARVDGLLRVRTSSAQGVSGIFFFSSPSSTTCRPSSEWKRKLRFKKQCFIEGYNRKSKSTSQLNHIGSNPIN